MKSSARYQSNLFQAGCKDPENPSVICNGRGSCICGGVCQCSADDFDFSVYGRYCECDDVNCARGAGGNLCSGNGECKCGDCRFIIGMLSARKGGEC